MSRTVADTLWEMLHGAGVRRCYGIVGDALNPTMDALRRHGGIEFISVRHEEFGAFAAVADALLTGAPVAVCGTAGPGTAHLVNGLLDARKEGAPVIAIAGDVETSVMDSDVRQELNPYSFFETSALYVGRLVNPAQIRPVVTTAINTAIAHRGPTVISLPGDIAGAESPSVQTELSLVQARPAAPAEADVAAIVRLIDSAEKVTIFGGQGCAGVQAAVLSLAQKLSAPVGYTLRGKSWLEADNPNAVGMTGLIGYGGAYDAVHEADVLLLLGTDFPYVEFLPQSREGIVQVDSDPGRLGRRVPVELAVVGDVGQTVQAVLERVAAKTSTKFLERCVKRTTKFRATMRGYVDAGQTTSPIRPEYLVDALDRIAGEDAIFTADTGTACIWAARYLTLGGDRQLIGSFSWASMANASPNAFGAQAAFPGRQTIALCGDGGFTMLALGDLITEVRRRMSVVHIVLNNSMLDFVHIEQQEAGLLPFGTELTNPDFAAVARALGASGVRVEEPGDVEPALREALAHEDGPTVLDVVVDRFALSRPAHIPAHTAKGFTLSLAKQVLNGDLGDVASSLLRNRRLV